METILFFLGFLLFAKLFLFWLWLWQLKEYHIGRFLAHFEAQAFKKIISSFWRKRFPKFTSKIIVIFFIGLLLAVLISFYFYFALFFLIVFAPLFSSLLVLLFQIPTVILRNRIIRMAQQKRARFKNLLVVGVTGSYGKTSTKEFLAGILSEKFNVLKTKERQNSEVGISQCVLNDLKPEHQIFIVEMGAYGRGGIKLLCNIVKPKIGILTGINEQHMATFGSLENIIKTKYELIESLPKDGTAFFNAKNKYCAKLYQKTKIKRVLYGENVKLAGLENIEGAKAVAREVGLSEEEIDEVCQKIDNKFGGIQIKKARLPLGRGININIIDATYSANPDSVIAHLEYLKTLPGRKVIIMPCLIELGSASKEVHKRIGKKIGEVCDLAIITTEDRFKEIQEGTRLRPAESGTSAWQAGEKVIFMENPKEIFEKIKSFCQSGDIILLESRVPNQLIKQLTINSE